ncbi:hypothetical protein [Paenibacillus terrigena]|uniref:hypothetical protein n=1 Tax=Paenibacillus terrigena TaxID=369333 RepID=UPI0028D2C14F|nr:hypothetical protein [Paenibacillus terrigena]
MNWQEISLVAAGLIGSGVAVIHGKLTQQLLIRPLMKSLLADERPIFRKLVPSLLHFTTFNWFLSGLALIASALWFEGDVRLAISLLVGSSYLYGAFVALRASRGRHPGGILYAVALGLIVFGISEFGY